MEQSYTQHADIGYIRVSENGRYFTVMAEGGYEGFEFGRLQTPLEIRKQAYWSHLAGGHHSYRHSDNWVSPSSSVRPQDLHPFMDKT